MKSYGISFVRAEARQVLRAVLSALCNLLLYFTLSAQTEKG